jgi:ABC-type nitrate/sulfonate/bicarbonate transport system substrate-binding protein
MNDEPLDQAAFDGFSLALRVMVQAFEIDAPATEFERPWQLVRDVAAGSATLTSTAELAARFPHMKDFLYDRVNSVIEADRDTANRVLRGLAAAFQ